MTRRSASQHAARATALAWLIAGGVSCGRTSSDPLLTEGAVLEREAQRREAYTRLDTAAVGQLLAEDYLAPSYEHGGGIHDRAAGVRAVLEHRLAADPYPIDSIRSDSTRVRIYGTVAIVTGIEMIAMTYIKHQPPEPRVVRNAYADVWALREGRWMLVNAQHTGLR